MPAGDLDARRARPEPRGPCRSRSLLTCSAPSLPFSNAALRQGIDLAGREPEAAVAAHGLHAAGRRSRRRRRPASRRCRASCCRTQPPATIDLAAFSRQAVASTTTGGLPGPATIARRLLARAARATAGPARDDQQLDALVVKQGRRRFERRRVDDREQVVDADRLADRLVEPADALGGDLAARRVGVEDDGVARRPAC